MTGLSDRVNGDLPRKRGEARSAAMKIKLDIECTAEEARRFLGLPDVQPMQEALLKQVQERISANINAMDAKAMIDAWLPAAVRGFEQFQQWITQFSTRSGQEK
jgi:hypothetical protein